MKRLVLLLLAAGGAAVWWKSRSGSSGQPWSAERAVDAPLPDDPPRLGGDVDADLLAILACPLDKQPVKREGNYLVCQECKRHYPIRDGIPVMLIDEALTPEQVSSSTA